MNYSYQYNVKILGIQQQHRSESSRESVDICMKLFSAIGAEIAEYDIDIVHRVPSRNSSYPSPIICKFTRRIAKENVIKCKKEISNIYLDDIGWPPVEKLVYTTTLRQEHKNYLTKQGLFKKKTTMLFVGLITLQCP